MAGEQPTLRADLLIELSDLQLSSGEIAQAFATINQSIDLARSIGDKDLVMNGLYGRSNVQRAAQERLYRRYLDMPFASAEDWRRCLEVEFEMRYRLADVITDLERARALAEEIGFPYFATSVQSEIPTFRTLEEIQNKTIALKTAQRAIAVGARPSGASGTAWHTGN